MGKDDTKKSGAPEAQKDLPACGLCFEDFEEGEQAAEIQCRCKHIFKPDHLSDWINHEK